MLITHDSHTITRRGKKVEHHFVRDWNVTNVKILAKHFLKFAIQFFESFEVCHSTFRILRFEILLEQDASYLS